MSDESKPYNELYIKAWTILSLIFSLVLFGLYVFGTHVMNAGHWVWDLIRYLFSPII